MPKMCGFMVPGGDAPVFVNPTPVRMLRPGPGYKHSVLPDDDVMPSRLLKLL